MPRSEGRRASIAFRICGARCAARSDRVKYPHLGRAGQQVGGSAPMPEEAPVINTDRPAGAVIFASCLPFS
jgi:hypothetical protein